MQAQIISMVNPRTWMNGEPVLTEDEKLEIKDLEDLNTLSIRRLGETHDGARQRIEDIKREAWRRLNKAPAPLHKQTLQLWMRYLTKSRAITWKEEKAVARMPYDVLYLCDRYRWFFDKLEVRWVQRGGIDAALFGLTDTLDKGGPQYTLLARWSTLDHPPLSSVDVETTLNALRKCANPFSLGMAGTGITAFLCLGYIFYMVSTGQREPPFTIQDAWVLCAFGFAVGMALSPLQRMYVFSRAGLGLRLR